MEIACALLGEDTLALDSVEIAERTERALRELEGIGAAVESERPGEVFFALDGLRGLHGGDAAGVLRAARAAIGAAVRIASGPTRFDAWLRASGRRAPVPVSALAGRLGVSEREGAELTAALRRLGIETLADLAALSPDRIADRFGPVGLRALRLARGEDDPPQPRAAHEELAADLELPEGAAGAQLDRALELLVDRLLADPRRRGRTVLALRLGALLSAGGSWSVDQGLARPTASALALRSVLGPRLEALPGPASSLRLRALSLGPRVGDQLELSLRGEEHRRRRLGEAIREVRAAQGGEALLEVLPLDPRSRFPERRAVLTPTAPSR